MVKIFNLYLSKGMFLLLAVESLIMFGAVPLGVHLRLQTAGWGPTQEVLWANTALFLVLGVTTMSAFGLYRREFEEGFISLLFRVVTSFVLVMAVMGFLYYLYPVIYLGRGALGTACLSAAGAVVLVRVAFFRWADLDILKHRVLVLGTGTRAAKIIELLRAGAGRRRMVVVGFLPLQGVHHFVDHSRILTDEAPLLDVVDKYQIDEIVIAVRERRGGGLPVNELLDCRLKGVHIVELSSFFERERGQVQLESLNASWMVLAEGFNQSATRDLIKRLFDLVTSLLLLVLTLPVMLITAVLIVLESGFPVLYRQERVGEGGRVFTIYKFRSMVQGAEKGTPQWAQSGDDRVTKVGKVIRLLRIDELPQIFNVLRGDMSFVGPRPERPFFVDQLMEQVPYYASRHSIKPGITGWAQVRYPYGASLEDAIEKLQYDLYYVKNHTFFLDLLILFQTAHVVLFGKGAR